MSEPTSGGRVTFVDDVLAGRSIVSEIDDYIDRWHDLPDSRPEAALELHDYLGLDWEEYRLWGEHPESLRFTFAARRADLPVEQVLKQAVGVAARSEDQSDALRVLRWLKDRGRIEDLPDDL